MVGRLDINKAEISNYSSQDAYEVPLQDTDGVTGQSETEYSNPNWTKYFGYFNNVGDLKQALLMKAVWAVLVMLTFWVTFNADIFNFN